MIESSAVPEVSEDAPQSQEPQEPEEPKEPKAKPEAKPTAKPKAKTKAKPKAMPEAMPEAFASEPRRSVSAPVSARDVLQAHLNARRTQLRERVERFTGVRQYLYG